MLVPRFNIAYAADTPTAAGLSRRCVGCSMRQVARCAMWLGNAGDLRDARAVLATGAEAVFELNATQISRRTPWTMAANVVFPPALMFTVLRMTKYVTGRPVAFTSFSSEYPSFSRSILARG